MPDQIRASHILIGHADAPSASSDLTRDDAMTQMTSLKEQIEAGTEFAALATEHSDCPSSAQGGDLGSFGPGAMVEPFDSTVFGLDVGQVSDVVETQFGLHLIHRTE